MITSMAKFATYLRCACMDTSDYGLSFSFKAKDTAVLRITVCSAVGRYGA
jgi:hypothetical protein